MPRVVINLIPKRRGGYSARKRIPKDVREEYARLYGNSSEEWFKSAPGANLVTARRDASEWSAEIENRIENIRAGRKGGGSELTHRQAYALAGEWYGWFVRRHENDLGGRPQADDPGRWWWRLHDLQEAIADVAPASVRNDGAMLWTWSRTDEARAKVRPVVADEAQSARFLASRGLVLSPAARDRFLDLVEEELRHAVKLLSKRAEGDYTLDKRPERFPAFVPQQEPAPDDLTPWQMFEAWIASAKPQPATITRWRAVFLEMEKHFAGRTAGSIAEDESQAWAVSLITEDRSAGTVRDVWVNAAKTVYNWAKEQRKLSTNPFKDVKIKVPKVARRRDGKAFTPSEAAVILKAALAIADTAASHLAAAKRWVPWLCAYTGARPGEMTQLRGQDVVKLGGVDALRITPDAGSVKTMEARVVPLHEHLITQGFIQFAKSKGRGPLFYNGENVRESDDPTKPARPRSVSQRQHLAAWVRELGVNDPELLPNHAWRHTFKQIADRSGITERVSDHITGHASANVSRDYGAPTLQDKANALKKFPRYRLK
jgi:integrase